MVPPVNARRRGVQQWSPERRRLNANYLDDPDPLIAVMTRVNRDDPILGNSALDAWPTPATRSSPKAPAIASDCRDTVPCWAPTEVVERQTVS